MLPNGKLKVNQNQVIGGAIALLSVISLGFLLPAVIRLNQDTAAVHKTPTEANKREFDVSLERVKTIVGGIGTIATIVGGIFLYVNYKQAQEKFEHEKEKAKKDAELSEDKQITERFSKAVEQLGSDKIEVRLGGIYSLERIAKDSPEDHWTIMEVLSAFIREQLPLTLQKPSPPNFAESFIQEQPQQELTPRELPTDIRAALTVIERRKTSQDPEGSRIDLSRLNFSQANLEAVRLQEANLFGANLQGTNFLGAWLQGADLWHTKLQGANLFSSNLRGAYLWFTNLQGADLSYTILLEANLWGVNLREADLKGTILNNSVLLATDLRDARNLTLEQLTGENSPLLCGVALPDEITGVDPNRDCDQISHWLMEHDDKRRISIELATAMVNRAKQKTWD